VVDFNLAFFQFIWECSSENIIKIGPYLPKLLQEKFGAVFLAHPVDLLSKTYFSCKNDVQLMVTDGALKLDDANVIFVDPAIQVDKT